jgi:hypothetical protein
MPQLSTFSQILLEPRPTWNKWKGALFLQGAYPWTASSIRIAYTVDEGDDLEVDYPEFLAQHSLTRVLPLSAFWEVLAHLQEQKSQPTIAEAVQAVNFYYKHDGYLWW